MNWDARGAIIAVFALLAASQACADDYTDARADLVAAYQAQDYDGMVVAAGKSLEARPGYPGALFNLALAQALLGDAPAALDTLTELLGLGADFGAEQMDEFAALRELPLWETYLKTAEALHTPAGSADVALQLDIDRFVPEGIAIGDDGTIYLGSIHKGQLIRASGEIEVLSDRSGHWSVFGMRFHEDGGLWFASAAVAQMADVGGDEGKTGIFRIDVETGDITRSALLAEAADAQLLGDLVIDGDTIFATDSLSGAVYRYDIGAGEFAAIVERGSFGSPQGLVLDESGEYLYVADYVGGLYRVRLRDGVILRLTTPGSMNVYGIDGLYRHDNELIAIQNGARPHRVTAFRLSDDGLGIQDARVLASSLDDFDEPTLGTVRGSDFYFVANSHWNRFDAENRLPDGLSGPIVLKLGLGSQSGVDSR